jgi:hypothetical protein
MDFFEKLGAEISFKKRTLTLSDRPEIQTEHSGTRVKHVAFTVFTQGKARHGPKPQQCKEASLAKHPSEGLHVGTIRQAVGLNPEEIAREQAKDPFSQRLNPGTYADKGEFFIDDQGLIYRRKPNDQSQLLVPNALVNEVIRENHSPVFVAHPGVRRTRDFIALKFWWPGMRRSIKEYIKGCDACQRRKEDREFRAPLGEVEEPVAPFQVTSMDITGPYPLTPRRNRYFLTFIYHYTTYVESFPIPDQSAQTCARVYATEILARHGTGSKLITEQGAAFMLVFFNETCRR